jgi:predicted O-methyltransferase YrrM/uncharacterized coiled-coil protein SlyX
LSPESDSLAKRAIKALPFLRSYFRKKEVYLEQLNAHIVQLSGQTQQLATEVERVTAECEQLRREQAAYGTLFCPPGHYYSPVVSLEEIRAKEQEIFAEPSTVHGIHLNASAQIQLLDELSVFYAELPFPEHKNEGLRYYFENDWYSYTDAIVLYGMIRRLSPRRIIEIGSGFSSCVILDTNDLFFENRIECQFIEPEPQRLLTLLRENEKDRIRLYENRLQDLEAGIFSQLEENDILFIDSSHVLKTGSDVNMLLREILPTLQRGVWIHFHDIFFPFEYPRDWVYEGRSWNEVYALRSFLQFNEVFSIRFFSDYLTRFHKEHLISKMPLCARHSGGNIWLRKDR